MHRTAGGGTGVRRVSTRRVLWAAAFAVAAAARPAATQESSRPRWLSPPHHAQSLPDYVAAVAETGLLPTRMPMPPLQSARLPDYVRDDRPPDYVASLRSVDLTSIAIPPPPEGEAPAVVRGVYLNGWVFGSSRFFDLVELADTTEINAFVIDVKDATGHVTYRSSVATAEEIGANALVRLRDPRSRLAILEAHGIHAIARIVVARDPLLARHKPEWAIRDSATGALWRDGLGEAWVDAFNDSVWTYAADLAAAAVLQGFKEVQFDYIRFPDEPPQRLNRAVYPARRPGESRRAAIRRSVLQLRDRIVRLGVPFTVDVFGLTTGASGDMGIGQVWEDLATAADVILPMVYPSHYRAGSYGIANPNRQPYEIVRRALEEAVTRSATLDQPARIRPYLQAFTIYRVRYTAAEVRDQIRAVEDVGLTDWVLWNARGVYPPGAFRPAVARDQGLEDPALPATAVT